MTITHPYAVAWTEGSPVPGAPPLPKNHSKSEEDYTDESAGGSHVGVIWDAVLVHGPISVEALKSKIDWGIRSSPLREYGLFHGIKPEKVQREHVAEAIDWYHRQRVEQCIVRGWLKIDDKGLLTVGMQPPNHEPPSVNVLKRTISAINPDKALEILAKKTDPARMKPDPAKREALKENIAGLGLLDRWGRRWTAPRLGPDGKPVVIVVNGRTRMEVISELRAAKRILPDTPQEMSWEEIPSDTPVQEVLAQRVAHEVHGTTKDVSPDGLKAYVKIMHDEGYTVDEISEAVGKSTRQVYRILSQIDMDGKVGQIDPQEENRRQIAEVLALHEEGWSSRRITGRMHISKSTVHRMIEAAKIAEAEAKAKADAKVEVEVEGGVAEPEDGEVITNIPEVIDAIIIEQTKVEVQNKVDKQSPTNRQKTAEGKAKAATTVDKMQDAIQKSGGGSLSKVKDIAGNRPSIRAAIFYSDPIRSTVVKALRDLGYTIGEPPSR